MVKIWSKLNKELWSYEILKFHRFSQNILRNIDKFFNVQIIEFMMPMAWQLIYMYFILYRKLTKILLLSPGIQFTFVNTNYSLSSEVNDQKEWK